MGGVLWDVQNATARMALSGLLLVGFGIVLITTFLINHFDLFGLRQVWIHLKGEQYKPLGFRTPGPYKHVRHPLYVGWLIAFWATPTMTGAHLVFALATTAYIMIAIQLEERDLVHFLGDGYGTYRQTVPMIISSIRPKRIDAAEAQAKAASGN